MRTNAMVVELAPHEAGRIEGGAIPHPMLIPFWGYVGSAAAAGWDFGYNTLGPALFGR